MATKSRPISRTPRQGASVGRRHDTFGRQKEPVPDLLAAGQAAMRPTDGNPSAILLAPYTAVRAACIYIDGLPDLFAAYGTACVQRAIDRALPERLAAIGIDAHRIARIGQHAVVTLADHAPPCSPDDDVLLERIKAAVSCEPLECEGHRILLKVLVTLGVPETCLEASPFDTARYPAHAWPPLPETTQSLNARLTAFRNDMDMATAFFDDVHSGHVTLAFQPVIVSSSLRVPLYHEALLRRIDGNTATTCYPVIQALERLGLVARLDRSVLWTAIGLLERHPDICLGANVSALSLQHDGWWRVLQDYLARNPGIAERLTLEITETSAITNAEEAANLLLSLRVMGCRIALDDMGAGYSTISFLAATRPNIVKIDKTFVTQTEGKRQPQTLLKHFVTLCSDLSACVIAEGIETEADVAAATQAGVHALQGYHLGRPELAPAWLVGPACVKDSFAHDHRTWQA
ncbi:EAL domain-containing protein [Achromobacter sp. 2789STDY5608621]|uniref:EAL domain-containing protein n=1 Tax=Achromobacter sp. 2789STDY5608621 TaxID=1806496 RepID=UPI0018D00AC7|nr:EAL domain-containing protein [Achromobacter sp. 2789STDY5608621]